MQFQPYNHYSDKLTTIEILLSTMRIGGGGRVLHLGRK